MEVKKNPKINVSLKEKSICVNWVLEGLLRPLFWEINYSCIAPYPLIFFLV